MAAKVVASLLPRLIAPGWQTLHHQDTRPSPDGYAACPGDLSGLRDRALLLLAAGGIGRTALVGLDAEQVGFDHTGVTLRLRDRPDDGPCRVRLARAADRRLCPARVLEDWLQASQTRFGPLFRKIDRWGNLEHNRLGADALRRILARRSLRRLRLKQTPA